MKDKNKIAEELIEIIIKDETGMVAELIEIANLLEKIKNGSRKKK